MAKEKKKSRSHPRDNRDNSPPSGQTPNFEVDDTSFSAEPVTSQSCVVGKRGRRGAGSLWATLVVSLAVLGVSVITGCVIHYHWPTPAHTVTEPDQRTRKTHRGYRSIESHQKATLFEHYSFDYEDVMKIREDNLRLYPFAYNTTGVDKRSKLSLQEFWDVYDAKWPVVVADVVPLWPAFNWSRDFFLEKYGKERVTMKAVDLPLDAAIHQVFPELSALVGDVSATPQSSLEKAVSLALPIELFYKNTHQAFPNQWTYVEDELFIPMRPELKRHIGHCVYLEEDFFRLFPPEVRPWDAMLLWGTQYSRSALHMDPYNWTGTNAVITGRKRWKLYPPGQDHLMYTKPDQRSGFPLDCHKYNSNVDAFDVDGEQFPLFAAARAIEFDQLPGELLIIPTGWYHQAYNVEETIAVSSQLMNRNNFRVVLEEILKLNSETRNSLPENVDDMVPHNQVEAVMKLLPSHILARGQAITKAILHQVAGKSDRAHGSERHPLG